MERTVWKGKSERLEKGLTMAQRSKALVARAKDLGMVSSGDSQLSVTLVPGHLVP